MMFQASRFIFIFLTVIFSIFASGVWEKPDNREGALLHALASYNSPETLITRKQLEMTETLIEFGKHSRADGFVAFNRNLVNPIVTIAFHGTEVLSDWQTNLDALKTKGGEIGLKGSVHEGFLRRYLHVQGAVHDAISKIVFENNLDWEQVSFVFSGHSLGGALASIGAVDFSHFYQQDVRSLELVTACSPRVFSRHSAKEVEDLLGKEKITRLWRDEDIVSTVAPGFLGFKHIGVSYKIPKLPTIYFFKNHDLSLLIDWVRQTGINRASLKQQGMLM